MMLKKLGEFAVNELCSRVPGNAASGCPSEIGPALRPADSYGNLKWSACKKRFFIRARESLFSPLFPLLCLANPFFIRCFRKNIFKFCIFLLDILASGNAQECLVVSDTILKKSLKLIEI